GGARRSARTLASVLRSGERRLRGRRSRSAEAFENAPADRSLNPTPHEHSRYFGVLSRFCRLPRAGGQDHGSSTRGTLHEEAARPELPGPRDPLLPPARRARAREPRLGRVLRQALPHLRPAAGDVHGVRAARYPLVREGDAGLAEGEALSPKDTRGRVRASLWAEAALAVVFGAPRVPRGLGVLPVALRGGRRALPGRRRRVGDDERLARQGRAPVAALGDSSPPLARAALLRVHLLHGVQGELGRVQGDGARAVREADLRSED